MASKSVRAVERAIDVLDVIRAFDGTAGVSDIGRELGLAKSTVHRLLVALSNKGVVSQNSDTDEYSLGYKIVDLAFSVHRHWDILSVSTPYLKQLSDEIGETAALALRVGRHYTYVAQAVGFHEYRFTPNLGQHYPLHWAATGKAILAYSAVDDLEAYLREVPLTRATDRTITDPVLLEAELKTIRNSGHSVSRGERRHGAVAIAAPILDHHGHAYAALCIIGPESRIGQEDLAGIGEQIADSSGKVSMACEPIALRMSQTSSW